MKKYLQTMLIVLLGLSGLQAQVIFSEDFEGGDIPAGWANQSNASDGGWQVGSSSGLSSDSWGIASNGSSRIAATNDDGCNCDKSQDYFITKRLDFTGYSSLVLKFQTFYGASTYQGVTETATIEVSLDSINWQTISYLEGTQGWEQRIVNLANFAGEDTVYIAFRYNDGGGWLYGWAIDDVSVEVPPMLDAEMVKVNSLPYGEENASIPITGTIFNAGATPFSSIEITYSVNGGAPVSEVLDNIGVFAFGSYDFETTAPWVPAVAGQYTVEVEVTAANGMADENPDNNKTSFDTEIYEKITPPNKIEEFLMSNTVLIEVATAADQLDKPTDLDFFPILGRNELWVINQRNESSGGSTLTINDATSDDPQFLHRVDGNAWHFMSLPTGIAFSSDNYNFASSTGVKDANHSGGTFTGPTLWSSDPAIYAQPSGGNGSHLDMLHGSPFSMGIAHEVDNVFWVYDDWNGDIVRYDFAEDHGPGNDYHGDAVVRRYRNLGINNDGDVPSHLVLDKTSGWMYIVDNGNNRVLRIDINSGSANINLPTINEPLAEHSQVTGFTSEVVIETGLDRACGIEIMENRLLVGDYATGEIIVFDIDNNFQEIGRIDTGSPGLTGIKVGPEGNIWYTNRILNSVMRAEPGDPNSTEEDFLKASVKVSPNPTAGGLTVRLPEVAGVADLTVTDLAGKTCLVLQQVSGIQQLELGDLPNGMYLLNIQTDGFSMTQKVVLEK